MAKRKGGLTMKRMKEALRLRAKGLGSRPIAEALGVGRTTVRDFFHRVEASGVTLEDAIKLSEEELGERIQARNGYTCRGYTDEFFSKIAMELKREHVTLRLLWEEHLESMPKPYSYSEFCAQFREWRKVKHRIWMHQEHKAGDKTFIDYAGGHIEIVDPVTGEIMKASLFVAVLGASNLTYAEATRRQDCQCWLEAQRRAFEYFGGTSGAVVPDNAKSVVRTPCWYDPELHPAYGEFARHYEIAVLTARIRKPKDKSKVEVGVQIAQRWILARLRNQTFFSLSEVNAAIAPLLETLNNRKMKAYGVSRRELFLAIEAEELRPLPAQPYVYAAWKSCRVGVNYHIQVEDNHYSVPYILIREKVDARLAPDTVEIYRDGRRITSHPRLTGRNKYSTHKEHMPAAHQHLTTWTPERLVQWASSIGKNTETLVVEMFKTRLHPEQAIRGVLGLLNLETKYGAPRLERAAKKAYSFGGVSLKVVANILKNNTDALEETESNDKELFLCHENIRGPALYH
jgi:transposase